MFENIVKKCGDGVLDPSASLICKLKWVKVFLNAIAR